MAHYITLNRWTDQGIRNLQDTRKRADTVKKLARKMGVTMTDIHWTLGSHDLVVIFDAPDDATMTALLLALGKAGNVRTETLRAFTGDEMAAILAKVP